MKYFTAIYMMPAEGLQEWMQKPEAERKEAEAKMQGEWNAWLETNKKYVQNTIALGKTKRVSKEGVADVKNGFMMSSYIAAESHEEAAEIFKNHPHLGIPGGTIEIMETRQLTDM